MTTRRFHVETLGCPKNAVDSDKIVATLLADGLEQAPGASDADLVVVNTCAFVEAAREESVETILTLDELRRPESKLVVTGCLAEREAEALRRALPEVDAVVGFAGEPEIAHVAFGGRRPSGVRDLLELERPDPELPWAYVKIAEGCDRACAFCAIPTFRGKQRSRPAASIVAESRSLVERGVSEIVLVAQDLASYGRDAGEQGALRSLLRELDALRDHGLGRLRLLYLYPSEVRAPLVEEMLALPSVVAYFDLSLQHASRRLLRSMRRPGSGDRFAALVEGIRAQRPDAVFRSSFICGFPGETESDHAELCDLLARLRLDWAGFFPFSRERGTAAAELAGAVPPEVVAERLVELDEIQAPMMAAARRALVGTEVEVLVDAATDEGAVGRTWREAPEIDGVVRVADAAFARPGALVRAHVTDAVGPDLEAEAIGPASADSTAPSSAESMSRASGAPR